MLPATQRWSVPSLLLKAMAQPMVLLLSSCALLYGLLGKLYDGAALLASIAVVVGIGMYQELRTHRVLETLRELSSPRSTVVRGGVARRIASTELVQGDRLAVQEGDRLACDALLLEAHSLRVDESMLTGEAVPVDKHDGAAAEGERRLHAGTLVVQGDGIAEVTAIGACTALGRIGGSVAALIPPQSQLQRELKRLVRAVALVALVVCMAATLLFSWRFGSWTEGLLVGLTLAMAIVPEEFAVAWAVMLGMASWRLAQAKVLTRQPQAIEVLGAATVLCVDKTGTLTCNRMEVVGVCDGPRLHLREPGDPVPSGFNGLLQGAALSSVLEGIEPMDQAILRVAPKPDVGVLAWREGVAPGRPFVRHCWMMAGKQAGRQLVAMKGAPEAMLQRCAGAAEDLRYLSEQATAWSRQGLRVIAVASQEIMAEQPVPESGYQALGLIALQDPLRAEVPAALQACRDAGVRVVMITGDAVATAVAIARQAGWALPEEARAALSGAQMDELSDSQLAEQVGGISVFARVTPAQKLRIVTALQSTGEVVAMTGDGVNDGPALRAADVGVAMGERGTDVAREAAALVLMDDRFASLVEGVRAGRRVFANLRKALGYLLAVHLPIICVSLLPLLGGPALLLPLHVVLLELIIDPACSLVFEGDPLRAQGMQVPPRPVHAPLFSRADVRRALLIGSGASLAVISIQAGGHWAGASEPMLRQLAVLSILAANLLALEFFRAAGAAGRNCPHLWLLTGVSGLALLIHQVPQLATAFGFPSGAGLDWASVVSLLPAAWALWSWRSGRRAGRASASAQAAAKPVP